MNTVLPPLPEKSLLVNNGVIAIDWFNWLKVAREYIIRILNKYDQNKSGSATLVAGTVTVAFASILPTHKILLFPQEGNTNIGAVYIASKTVGVGFVIQSSNASDTRTVFYKIEEAF